jgi:aconitase B
MGKTITEKILAKASGKAKVSPGEYVHMEMLAAGGLYPQLTKQIQEGKV